AVLLAVLGSNWSAPLTLAVLVWAPGLSTRAWMVSLRGGVVVRGPTEQTPVVGSMLPWLTVAETTVSPGERVQNGDVGGGVRAGVGQGDGERDRVADVGLRVAHRLGQPQVGLLRRRGGAGRVVARVRVELVGGADGRGIGLGRGGVHAGAQRQ